MITILLFQNGNRKMIESSAECYHDYNNVASAHHFHNDMSPLTSKEVEIMEKEIVERKAKFWEED